MYPFHTAAGLVALLAGPLVFALPKGTKRHRRAGWVYVTAMLLLCGSSFGLYGTTPNFEGFGAFHVMALFSLATVLAGLVPVLLRRRFPGSWFPLHYHFMLWSYVGLLMALGSHVADGLVHVLKLGGLPHGWAWLVALGVCWGLPPAVGGPLIKRHFARFMQRFGTAVQPESELATDDAE